MPIWDTYYLYYGLLGYTVWCLSLYYACYSWKLYYSSPATQSIPQLLALFYIVLMLLLSQMHVLLPTSFFPTTLAHILLGSSISTVFVISCLLLRTQNINADDSQLQYYIMNMLHLLAFPMSPTCILCRAFHVFLDWGWISI